ncbi:hypothetical protein D3C76_1779610 [compost metagenome]
MLQTDKQCCIHPVMTGKHLEVAAVLIRLDSTNNNRYEHAITFNAVRHIRKPLALI